MSPNSGSQKACLSFFSQKSAGDSQHAYFGSHGGGAWPFNYSDYNAAERKAVGGRAGGPIAEVATDLSNEDQRL